MFFILYYALCFEWSPAWSTLRLTLSYQNSAESDITLSSTTLRVTGLGHSLRGEWHDWSVVILYAGSITVHLRCPQSEEYNITISSASVELRSSVIRNAEGGTNGNYNLRSAHLMFFKFVITVERGMNNWIFVVQLFAKQIFNCRPKVMYIVYPQEKNKQLSPISWHCPLKDMFVFWRCRF